jgi:hypothetical protein
MRFLGRKRGKKIEGDYNGLGMSGLALGYGGRCTADLSEGTL